MKSLNELLDAIKERRNLETDSALATALGVKRQTVSNWRQGRNTPDAVACATIAGLSGEPLARVIGLAGEQRAISQEEKAVWRKLAATAIAALCAIGFAFPSLGKAHQIDVSPYSRTSEIGSNAYYVNCKMPIFGAGIGSCSRFSWTVWSMVVAPPRI